jgi:glycosyltransferase involved in cell wall biosynthesis
MGTPHAETGIPEHSFDIDMAEKLPHVGIALPVYNGEAVVGQTLQSLLAQTHRDFVVVVCDNASTDRTGEICREFVARDPRIRYHRQPANVGPMRNFNDAFLLTPGMYFKWAPDDDVYHPTYLERCVAVLDRNPDVVLAHSKTALIDDKGTVIGHHTDELDGDHEDPSVRFTEMLKDVKCFEIFGVFRREALASTPLIGGFGHSDGVLLARIALMGKIVEVPEYLYFNRDHETKSLHQYSTYRDYTVWLDPSQKGKILLPRWRMGYEYAKAAMEVPLPPAERRRALLNLLPWGARMWKSLAWNVVMAGYQAVTLPFQRRPPAPQGRQRTRNEAIL